MKHQRSSQQMIRLAFWLVIVIGCLAYASASAASLSGRTPARTRTPPGLARKTATPTRKHLPPGLAKKTPTPTATLTAIPAWSGSVLINGGVCCVGGCPGQVVYLHVAFSASSPFGAVTEMRVPWLAGDDWEPFAPYKSYPWTVVVNWINVRINAQFRDEHGNLSPIYWDDILQEGMVHPWCPTYIPAPFMIPGFSITPNTAVPR